MSIDNHKLIEIAQRHRLSYLALFGSYAREEAEPDSDVDLYVRFGRDVRLFEILRLKHEMEDALGLPVALVVEEAVHLHQSVRSSMEEELITLYESIGNTP